MLQTYTNFEIIFWDNASKDESANIAKAFMSNDKRLKYFFVKKMTSLGEARVLAINEANGELLAFLDCDDIWMPSKLEKQVNIESIIIEDKSFLHKNHAGNQVGKFHLKIILKSIELKKLSRIESNKKIYKILGQELKNYIHSIQILIS